jgi:hypothetical protein
MTASNITRRGMIGGIAAVLSLAWTGNAISQAVGVATTPAQMSCVDFANTHKDDAGLTTPTFSVSSYAIVPASKSATESCGTIDVSKLAVTRTISSRYWVWAVLDTEKSCQAAAAKRNSALQGYEQEHIGDADTIVAAQTTKLRDALRGKQWCAATAAAAGDKLRKDVDPALQKALADTKAEWSKAVQKRDSGSHTYPSDCSCAN